MRTRTDSFRSRAVASVWATAALALLFGAASSVEGQLRPQSLGGADAVLPTPFANATRAVELADGAVVILDARDGTVYRADADLRDARRIGTKGRGPGEYLRPRYLLEREGRGPLVVDADGPKLIEVSRDGRQLQNFEPAGWSRCPAERVTMIRYSRSVDARGRFLGAVPPIQVADGRRMASDSSAVVRWSRACVRDTVGFIESEFGSRGMVVGDAVVAPPGTPRLPFVGTSSWTGSASGIVWLLRVAPYRAEVFGADGGRTRGPELSFDPVAVTATLRERWRDQAGAPSPTLVIRRENPNVQSEEMIGRDVPEPPRWPTHLPPFLPDGARFASGELLFAQRASDFAAAALVDVLDSRGQRVAVLSLPPRRTVVGVGKSYLYAEYKDEDEISFVERYALPESLALRAPLSGR